MKVTVLGASGNVGRQVVALLLGEGHQVTAFVHGQVPFDDHPQLRVVKGDIHATEDVAQAVRGCDAVISTLGSWHTPTKDILSAGMRATIPVMEEQAGKRLVSLTGSEAQAAKESVSFVTRATHIFFGIVAPKIISDAEEHLRLLAESQLSWTVLRSPVMRDKGAATYSLSDRKPLPWETIPRVAVARALVDQLNDTSRVQQAPHVHAANR